MSDTSRTDAAILTEPHQVRELVFEVVKADHMAELERELNEARKTIELKDAAISLLQIGKYGTVHLSDQLNEANADRLRLRVALQQCKADADALAEAVEIMRVGICSAAMPNATEREIASDAVKQASKALETYRTKYKEGDQ
jgi:hypothetical protein